MYTEQVPSRKKIIDARPLMVYTPPPTHTAAALRRTPPAATLHACTEMLRLGARHVLMIEPLQTWNKPLRPSIDLDT